LYASPAYAWICGGGTVNPLHFDLNEALLAQVVGEKHFLLFPPEDSPRIAGRVERAIFRTTSLDFLQPDRERFPRLDGATPYEAVVGPGDVLYIPYRWWHAMVALEPSVSVTWWWEPSHMAHVHNALRQRAVDAAKSVLRALRVT
jgi:ribosomal protein L16 Arg81 hydroxylase